MRLNRTSRLGLALIVFAAVILIFWKLADRAATNSAPAPVVASAPAPAAQPVAVNSQNLIAKALVDIPAHSLITPNEVEMMALPSGQKAAPGDVTQLSQVSGYVTAQAITHGATINHSELIGHITEVGVSAMLNPGFRAMSIAIPSRPTLHDLVKVGDYVDIVASFDGQETRTIVANRRVLSVDVYGAEYPPTSLAQRGDYKAAPPQAPTPVPTPGAPLAPGAAPTPVPAATNAPPKPEASLTLELTPKEVTAVALAESAGATLDYTLRPRPAEPTTGTEVLAALIKPQIAPYDVRVKGNGGAAPAKAAAPARHYSTENERPSYFQPSMPPLVPPAPTGGLVPVPPPAPETYTIPVYGDGKMIRQDTVLKPQ